MQKACAGTCVVTLARAYLNAAFDICGTTFLIIFYPTVGGGILSDGFVRCQVAQIVRFPAHLEFNIEGEGRRFSSPTYFPKCCKRYFGMFSTDLGQ